MGQRGPAPEPVALKLLKGETRPSQHAKAPDPMEPPVKPDGLSADATKVWDRMLACTDHIGQRHAEVFRQYCETITTINAMQPKGSREWRDLVLVNLRLARELCLTPATGAHLTKPKAAEKRLDKYLTG